MTPSGHKAFLVQNPGDVELLLMHNRTYAAEYVFHDTDLPATRSKSLIGALYLQDRTRRLFPQAYRDPRQGQGSRCQGHQPQGTCLHRRLNVKSVLWLSVLLSYGVHFSLSGHHIMRIQNGRVRAGASNKIPLGLRFGDFLRVCVSDVGFREFGRAFIRPKSEAMIFISVLWFVVRCHNASSILISNKLQLRNILPRPPVPSIIDLYAYNLRIGMQDGLLPSHHRF